MKTEVCALLMLMGAVVAYPDGPPTDAHPDICKTMMPQHGNYTSKPLDTLEFTINTESTCFKENGIIKVSIGNKSLEYFEGFFILANKPGKTDAAYGTFQRDEDFMWSHQTKGLKCFDRADSAFGQSKKQHYHEVSFKWIAPSDLKEDIDFRATIVHETEDFWVGATKRLKYDANCDVDVSGATNLGGLLSLPMMMLVAMTIYVM